MKRSPQTFFTKRKETVLIDIKTVKERIEKKGINNETKMMGYGPYVCVCTAHS